MKLVEPEKQALLGRRPDYGDGVMMCMYCEVVRELEPEIMFLSMIAAQDLNVPTRDQL